MNMGGGDRPAIPHLNIFARIAEGDGDKIYDAVVAEAKQEYDFLVRRAEQWKTGPVSNNSKYVSWLLGELANGRAVCFPQDIEEEITSGFPRYNTSLRMIFETAFSDMLSKKGCADLHKFLETHCMAGHCRFERRVCFGDETKKHLIISDTFDAETQFVFHGRRMVLGNDYESLDDMWEFQLRMANHDMPVYGVRRSVYLDFTCWYIV